MQSRYDKMNTCTSMGFGRSDYNSVTMYGRVQRSDIVYIPGTAWLPTFEFSPHFGGYVVMNPKWIVDSHIHIIYYAFNPCWWACELYT